MGNQQQKLIPQSPTKGIKLKIATLNYCGIAYSPFEFYCEEYKHELSHIGSIFKSLIHIYLPHFDANFKWVMGKLEVKFKKGRYSNMFNPKVGTKDDKLLTRQEFETEWNNAFQAQKGGFKFQWNQKDKQTVRLYDFMMYHTLLIFVFKTPILQEAIKHKASDFIQAIQPFYKLSFLNQITKLNKFLAGFDQLKADIFFLQEFSKPLKQKIIQLGHYHVVTDLSDTDSMILIRKGIFDKDNSNQPFFKEIKAASQKKNWAAGMAIASFDNFIIISAHLTSNVENNKIQKENLEKDLIQLKNRFPSFEIVLGGDINSYFAPGKQFSERFQGFPSNAQQITTIKKRTTTQAQYHKAQLSVKQSKDKLITTLRLKDGVVTTINGQEFNQENMIPSDGHPFDHYLCSAQIRSRHK